MFVELKLYFLCGTLLWLAFLFEFFFVYYVLQIVVFFVLLQLFQVVPYQLLLSQTKFIYGEVIF